MYGNCLVGVFEFSKAERDELELRIKNLGKGVYGNIRFRCFLPEMSNDKNILLINKGIDSKIIVAISWIPCTRIENIYPSSQKRTVTPIIINSPVSGNDSIIWTYEFLKRLKQNESYQNKIDFTDTYKDNRKGIYFPFFFWKRNLKDLVK